MILDTQQQVEQAQPSPAPEFCFAVVAAVHSDGLSLYIGAEKTPTQKHYKCNTSCRFSAGQKVYIQKAGGEYVVLFPIGDPATEIVADRADVADRAEVAETVQSNDDENDRITLSANPKANGYFAHSKALGWKQIG